MYLNRSHQFRIIALSALQLTSATPSMILQKIWSLSRRGDQSSTFVSIADCTVSAADVVSSSKLSNFAVVAKSSISACVFSKDWRRTSCGSASLILTENRIVASARGTSFRSKDVSVAGGEFHKQAERHIDVPVPENDATMSEKFPIISSACSVRSANISNVSFEFSRAVLNVTRHLRPS